MPAIIGVLGFGFGRLENKNVISLFVGKVYVEIEVKVYVGWM